MHLLGEYREQLGLLFCEVLGFADIFTQVVQLPRVVFVGVGRLVALAADLVEGNDTGRCAGVQVAWEEVEDGPSIIIAIGYSWLIAGR